MVVIPKVDQTTKVADLLELNLADNQLGMTSGHAIAAFIINNKSLTSLDLSNNALSYDGGLAVTEALEKIYSIPPRDFFKQILWRIEEKKYTGRHAIKRPKLYTNMINLNMSRNHLGPSVLSSIMVTHSLTYLLTHLLTHLLTYSLTHLLTHSLAYQHTHCFI